MSHLLGKKLRQLRKNADLSQQGLAQALNLSSEFISLLERSKRFPSLETLTALSRYFKKDVSYFLEEKRENFDVLFKDKSLSKKTKSVLQRFKKYCDEYLNLEEAVGRHLELAPSYSHVSPSRMAVDERMRLGLGSEPISNIFSLLEWNGLRVVRIPLPEDAKISSLFIYLENEMAAFCLLDARQSPDTQVEAAAHAYCHFLKDRLSSPIVDNPDVLIDEYLDLYHPREKFAQNFALEFLVPPQKIKSLIEKDIRHRALDFKDGLYLRRYFRCSMRAILVVLRNLGCISNSQYKTIQKRDDEKEEEKIYGERWDKETLKQKKTKMLYSDRFINLAIEAYKKKKISPEKLSHILGKDSRYLR